MTLQQVRQQLVQQLRGRQAQLCQHDGAPPNENPSNNTGVKHYQKPPSQVTSRGLLIVLVLLGLCMGAIGMVRGRLCEQVASVQQRNEVYSLPPAHVLRHLSMGYQSALADYLWAHVLVTQGLRMQQKRAFHEVGQYLEAIVGLDPWFRQPYRLADTLLVLQVGVNDQMAAAQHARQMMLRGLERFPYDAELWLNYGQFLAYLAPSIVPKEPTDPNEDPALYQERITQWKREGVRALVRAGELGGADDSVAIRSMSAATLLTFHGQTQAAIRFLERLYASTDNAQAREDIGERLLKLRKDQEASRDFRVAQAFDRLWREDAPFGPASLLSVLGPPVNTWKCAGPQRDRKGVSCARTWSDWAENELKTNGQGLGSKVQGPKSKVQELGN